MKKPFVACVLLGSLFVPVYRAQAPSGDMQNFDGCSLEGDAKPQPLKNLNRLKNRFTPPAASQMNPQITLDAILAPGNDLNRWSESQGATVTGYVIDVKPGGPETVNCHAADPPHVDTHIELAVNPGDSQGIKHMIVKRGKKNMLTCNLLSTRSHSLGEPICRSKISNAHGSMRRTISNSFRFREFTGQKRGRRLRWFHSFAERSKVGAKRRK